MELTKEYLQKKALEYRQAAEQLKNDSIANIGAAQALEGLIKEMENQEEPGGKL
jgi:hypothetical protein